MSECPNLKTCPFFNDKMSNMPAIANIYKRRYCLGEGVGNEGCARWIVYSKLGKEYIPADLFPNQIERAEQILKSSGGEINRTS
ncbi:hypothetical protein [Caldicellulosiruptor morganii]|uniref:Uncharacterized protein n=1 Tax=Caldicellulosiruptor morganii TaxID=1387555 RepID=A0ABY7BKL9_9FIRM|nr:hypothetical protein [Caldicellulosiruptor morganii]WAM33035.1 hypothetical protein OTK00_001496 [Caldicellulosiruptor morganii]